MAYQECITIPVGQDLADAQYKAVTLAGTVAATPQTAVGIVQSKPRSTENFCEAAFWGRSKFLAGGAVNSAALLTVSASGFITAATSGDPVVGRALHSCASGSINQMGIFDFAAPNKGF